MFVGLKAEVETKTVAFGIKVVEIDVIRVVVVGARVELMVEYRKIIGCQRVSKILRFLVQAIGECRKLSKKHFYLLPLVLLSSKKEVKNFFVRINWQFVCAIF